MFSVFSIQPPPRTLSPILSFEYNGKVKITYPGKIEWTSRKEPMDELIFEWKEGDEVNWSGRLVQIMCTMVSQMEYYELREFTVERVDK